MKKNNVRFEKVDLLLKNIKQPVFLIKVDLIFERPFFLKDLRIYKDFFSNKITALFKVPFPEISPTIAVAHYYIKLVCIGLV